MPRTASTFRTVVLLFLGVTVAADETGTALKEQPALMLWRVRSRKEMNAEKSRNGMLR